MYLLHIKSVLNTDTQYEIERDISLNKENQSAMLNLK